MAVVGLLLHCCSALEMRNSAALGALHHDNYYADAATLQITSMLMLLLACLQLQHCPVLHCDQHCPKRG